MIVETAVGKLQAVALKTDPTKLVVSSSSAATIDSMLDGIELIGGAISEDQDFDRSLIETFTPPFKTETWFSYTVTKTQFVRYLQYEVLNFMDYTSVTQMRKL